MHPVEYQGCQYDSHAELHRTVGHPSVSYDLFMRRLRNGSTLHDALTNKSYGKGRRPRPVVLYGVTFPTPLEALEAFGYEDRVTVRTLRRKMERAGLSFEQAVAHFIPEHVLMSSPLDRLGD